jgi:hypothetical protein
MLDLKSVTYGEITAANLLATLVVKDSTVTLKPSTLELCGAAVQMNGRLNPGASPWKYDGITLKADKLPVAPLVNTFAPAFKDMVSGEIKSLSLSAAGSGVTPANLARTFAGGATLSGEKLQIGQIQKLISESISKKSGLKSLVELVTAIGLGDMQQLTFDTAEFDIAADGGRMLVRKGALTGPDLLLALLPGGSIGFDQTLNLDMQMGFAGALEQNIRRVRLTPLLGAREGKHLLLPQNIPIRGNFTNPQSEGFNWKKLLTQKGLETGLEALGEAINAKKEGKGVKGKDILGKILGGTEEQAAPAAPVTPAVPAAPVTPQVPAQPGQQLQPGQTVPATPQTPATPEKPKKKKKSDAWLELGAGVANELLKPKDKDKDKK